MKQPITLVHASDLHFTQAMDLKTFLRHNRFKLNKRQIGWLNFMLRRRHHFPEEIKQKIIKKISEIDYDYLIISGDLTTFSLKVEFENALARLDPLIRKGNVILVPGNHDRYIKEKEGDSFTTFFGDRWSNQEKIRRLQPGLFDIEETLLLLNLDMAVPRSMFSSRGKVSVDLDKYKEYINGVSPERTKIAIGHYPAFLPPKEFEGALHALSKRKIFERFLLDCDFQLYLHGHIHKSWHHKPLEDRSLIVINSGGCCRFEEGPSAGFHRITIRDREISVKRISCQTPKEDKSPY